MHLLVLLGAHAGGSVGHLNIENLSALEDELTSLTGDRVGNLRRRDCEWLRGKINKENSRT